MLPHQERVVTEEIELTEKITKLGAFFDSKVFRALTSVDRDLLTQQYRFMRGYQLTLRKRIELFGE